MHIAKIDIGLVYRTSAAAAAFDRSPAERWRYDSSVREISVNLAASRKPNNLDHGLHLDCCNDSTAVPHRYRPRNLNSTVVFGHFLTATEN